MIKNKVLTSCLFGVTCLAAIYVLFGPNLDQPKLVYSNNRKRKKAIRINGLENNENNCYANTIIQSLCSSESFIDWLEESLLQQKLISPNLMITSQQQPAIQFINYLFSIIFRNNFFYNTFISSELKSIKFVENKTLTYQLLKLMQEVNNGCSESSSLNASKVLETLYNFNFQSGNEQQDAHELYSVLISSLETEILRTLLKKNSWNAIQTNTVFNKNTQSDLLNNGIDERHFQSISNAANNEIGSNDRVLPISEESSKDYDSIKKSLNLKRNLPTKGLLAHQIWCLRCDHKYTTQFESFHSISLAIPSARRSDETITLKDCLNSFVSSELLKDVVCGNCKRLYGDKEDSSMQIKSTLVKRLTFAKLPQMFVIHFQRLIFSSNGMLIKKKDRVKFPSILTMDEYQYEQFVVPRDEISSLSKQVIEKLEINRSNPVDNQRSQTNDEDMIEISVDAPSRLIETENNKEDNHSMNLNLRNSGDGLKSNVESSNVDLELNDDASITGDQLNERLQINGSMIASIESEFKTVSNEALTLIEDKSDNPISHENDIIFNTEDVNKISTNQSLAIDAQFNDVESNGMSTHPIESSLTILRQKDCKYKYKLNACIVHLGNSFSGHYVSVRRLPNNRLNYSNNGTYWYFTSDMTVKPSSVEEAMSLNAYMLFYERIHDKTSSDH